VSYCTVTEGKTRLRVPSVSLSRREPPTSPVFFNPAASINRDVSVAITAETEGDTYCDALAGVGARGVRIAREVERKMEVTLVDFNEASLKLAKQSIRANRVEGRCHIVKSGTNAYLYSRFGRDARFDYVDVDPFGTPVPYLQGAIQAAAEGGIFSATATDTAVLCGVYRGVCERRYGAVPLNNHFKHETGLRILLNFCKRVAASLDIGLAPVFAHSTRHYMRVYAAVEWGPSRADRSLEQEGYLSVCPECGQALACARRPTVCEVCKEERIRVAGPLWLGRLVDERIAKRAASSSEGAGLLSAGRVLRAVAETADLPPFSYSLEEICSALKIPSVSEKMVVESLGRQGYISRRQPFEKMGLKSTASFKDVAEAVKEAAAATTHAAG
jgi:tRNA (guanine26-N2/guanine27-N2)-dimethyltransferase